MEILCQIVFQGSGMEDGSISTHNPFLTIVLSEFSVCTNLKMEKAFAVLGCKTMAREMVHQ